MSYTKCLVIFIDILGTQDRNSFETLFEVNNIFHKQLEAYEDNNNQLSHTVYERKVHTFSDCAYIFYYFKENIEENRKDLGKLFKAALYNTEFLILEFLSHDFLCRGGITYGDAYFEKDRSLFFGPAVNRAYYLESKIAKYPRIVVDNEVFEEVEKAENKLIEEFNRYNPLSKVTTIEETNGKILKLDSDKLYYLNYLNSMQLGHNFYTSNRMSLRGLNKSCLEFCSKEIQKFKMKKEESVSEEEANKMDGILSKYEWFKIYLENSNTKNVNGFIFY